MPLLKFIPFQSSVDIGFWQSFVSKKLDILKLSSEPQPIHGNYSSGQIVSDAIHLPGLFTMPSNGLEIDSSSHVKGTLINTNTIQEFRLLDKNQLFQQTVAKIIQAVQSKEALDDPSLLNQFLLLTFADLKKYKFYYWFAFPAIIPSSPWLCHHQEPMKLTLEQNVPPYFLIKTDGSWQTAPLNQYETFQTDQECMIGWIDPSTSPDAFGWPLRNLLYLVHTQWQWRKAKVICYRPGQTSYCLSVELPESGHYTNKAVGWEKNVQGTLGPRMADLGPLMDPVQLADTSVDLNLKLMRWRILPDLDLDRIKQTKCLLLGAGTLGCYVARCLLGWGVRHITFVDNGRVSFSNPVRQPLYQFKDALQGGSLKAETAADQLRQIQPTVVSKGYDLTIPMPGHPSSSDQALEQDRTQLARLIEEHDVVYLLTDSRESRWFPTMLAAYHKKLVINSALGFDTFLVMRHGSVLSNLGCYFCNDIVAPTDSLTDRTLDQQCTVTRPGLAAIAGALSVELMVSVIQHPEGYSMNAKATDQPHLLGLLPHQIRGFLGQFSNMLIVGQAYDRCTACSRKILEAYDHNPLDFLKKVLKEPDHLEQITGLADLKKESEALLLDDWAEEVEEDF
ncbi:Ubiquitin-like modifier-activating enzyme ATG7 [Choanephora cucurbitarum]|uniref:Ubiquitin-like modifier-activating enzyme ATG7 n=1 Tax=Choanephora cucurbitarum TaxID=101091 RepID=A0A1C7N9E0_9FUNG|nr:Ubiquitin-like modifier-activating enzyme ATG7 [Choanephora cucurbitarum]